MAPIRVLVAEDVDLVAEAFAVLLGLEENLEVVGRVNRGDLLVAAIKQLTPDVAVVDVDMPGRSGIEAAADVRAAGLDCKILLLTALPGSGHIPRALSAGANGYLLKSATGSRLTEAIHIVAAGGTAIDPQLAADALRMGPPPLTDRETELLRLVDQGVATDSIAERMRLSKGTVRNYLSNAMMKLEATTRAEAVLKARRQGWL